MLMIEKMAWNTFKNTGNINTFLELKEVEKLDICCLFCMQELFSAIEHVKKI